MKRALFRVRVSQVTSVSLVPFLAERSMVASDASDATIDLSAKNGTKLTLVTCDTLTRKSARFILTANFGGTVGVVGDDGKSYFYSVESVVKADASDATIDLSAKNGT